MGDTKNIAGLSVIHKIPTSLKNTFKDPSISPTESMNIEKISITGIIYKRLVLNSNPINNINTVNGIRDKQKLNNSLPISAMGYIIFGILRHFIRCPFLIKT